MGLANAGNMLKDSDAKSKVIILLTDGVNNAGEIDPLTAAQAAGKIHTDFERGFIRAEVISYDDFVALGGEAAAKEAGKLRLEGKNYIVQEGDTMHFRFNV